MARNPCSGAQWQRLTANFRLACAINAAPCALCGEPIDYHLDATDRMGLTVDHIHPRWAGGAPLDPANWQPAHRSCNSARGARETNPLRARRRPQPPRITELTWTR